MKIYPEDYVRSKCAEKYMTVIIVVIPKQAKSNYYGKNSSLSSR